MISPRIAYLLSKLVSDEHLDLPDPSRDDNVAVYYRRKRSGNYDENDYYKWERPFLDKMVTPTDLRSRPNGYLVHLDFQSLNELIDIRPEKGTPFIFSISEHMVEEDVEGIVLKNWLNHFEMQYHQLHASGHMSMVELGETVRRISARAVFPIHTEHPEMFSKLGPGTILTEKEKEYVI